MVLGSPVGHRVAADRDGATVTIKVGGLLDGIAASALLDTLRTELDRGPTRVDVDLGPLVDFTDDGLEGLAACRHLCNGVSDGLHFRTEGGAGGEALLLAFAAEPAADEEE